MSKKNKIRVDFRKNRQKRARNHDLTKQANEDFDGVADLVSSERVSGKGAIGRRRTIIAHESHGGREVDETACRRGRVLYSIGANNTCVQSESGEVYTCTIRQVVRMLERESRNAVVAGDEVLFTQTDEIDGVIERVEPRKSTLSRGSHGSAHTIAANIDQAVIVTSVAEPDLKLGLIDRFLCSTEKGGIEGIICINKIDLCHPAKLQPIVGQYARLGYHVVLTNAITGEGIDDLKDLVVDKATVFAGQSGVGKSSLLNAIQPGIELKTAAVSQETQKGRHTTRVAELVQLDEGGWIVDTPGIRQLQLWDVEPGEVEGMFLEFRALVPQCRYPDCTHLHEDYGNCAIKSAVEMGMISPLRYESYVRILTGDDSYIWSLHRERN